MPNVIESHENTGKPVNVHEIRTVGVDDVSPKTLVLQFAEWLESDVANNWT